MGLKGLSGKHRICSFDWCEFRERVTSDGRLRHGGTWLGQTRLAQTGSLNNADSGRNTAFLETTKPSQSRKRPRLNGRFEAPCGDHSVTCSFFRLSFDSG